MARTMKDSGILWIGEIPNEWEVVPHKYVMHKEKEICEKYNGEDIISLTMNGVIVRDLVNPTGKMPATFDGYQRVYAGNLLMCLFDIDVTPRCIGYIKNNGLTSPAYSQFVVDNGNYPQYYDYLLRMIDDGKHFLHLSKNLRSSLTEENFGAIKTIVPSVEEQKKIADFLDVKVAEINSIIKQTKEAIEEYKQYKKAVITEAVTKGLNAFTPMKDSGIEWIGEIPQNWKVLKVKNIGTYRNGLTYEPQDITDDGGVLVLRSSNVQGGKIVFEDNVYVKANIREELMVKKGDILICSRNGSRELIGKNAVIEEEMVASFGAFMMIFRCDCPRYMYYILNSSVFSYYLGTFFTSTINQLTGSNFGNMKVVFCEDEHEQQEIVNYLDVKCAEIDALIAKKEAFVEEMETYKKSLIYEYVTGKKEVL